MKAVVCEKLELEKSFEVIFLLLFGSSGRSGTSHMDESECFSNNSNCKSVIFLTDENRDVSKLTEHFGKIGVLGLWHKAENHNLSNGILWSLSTFSDWGLNEIIEFSIIGDKRFATQSKLNTTCASWYSLNLGITEQHFALDALSMSFFDAQKTGVVKKLIPKNGRKCFF